MLFGHDSHSFFFEFRQGDHGRRQGDVTVVLEFRFGLLDFLGEFFVFLLLSRLNCTADGFVGLRNGFSAGVGHFVNGPFGGISRFF